CSTSSGRVMFNSSRHEPMGTPNWYKYVPMAPSPTNRRSCNACRKSLPMPVLLSSLRIAMHGYKLWLRHPLTHLLVKPDDVLQHACQMGFEPHCLFPGAVGPVAGFQQIGVRAEQLQKRRA